MNVLEVLRMIANKSLLLLTIVGLVAGCSARTPSQPDGEPSPVPSVIPSPLPTQTIPLETETVPVDETPEAPTEQLSPGESGQPPVDRDGALRPPVEGARRDLARRLQVDLAWVEVVETVTRQPDAETMPCLTNGTVPEELWANLDQVQWITLSVKQQVHHYLVLDDFIVYCQM
jgi:hypothetical protein